MDKEIDKIADIATRTGHSEGCIDYGVETLQDAGHPDWNEAISLVEEAITVGEVKCYCPAADKTEARTFTVWEKW